MMFATIHNNIIDGIYCGDKSLYPDAINIPDSFQGVVGMRVDSFNEDWSIKPLKERVSLGAAQIPKGFKIVDDAFVPITELDKSEVEEVPEDFKPEGDNLILLTKEERIEKGLEDLPKGMIIEEGHLRDMTDEEKVLAGDMTQEELDKKWIDLEILGLKEYLSSTDWYVTRLMERSVPIPDEVKTKRLEAVNRISELKI